MFLRHDMTTFSNTCRRVIDLYRLTSIQNERQRHERTHSTEPSSSVIDDQGAGFAPYMTGSSSEGSLIFQMRFEDVFGCLGFEDVQLTTEGQEVGVEMTVGHDLHQIVVIVSLLTHLNEMLLTT